MHRIILAHHRSTINIYYCYQLPAHHMSPKDTVIGQIIFSVSEYQGSNSLLNMIKFKYSTSKPRAQREVNEGLGRHTRQPMFQDIWSCPNLARWYQLLWQINKLLYKTITYTSHLYSAWQFSGSMPISIMGWQCFWSLCQFSGGMETSAWPSL